MATRTSSTSATGKAAKKTRWTKAELEAERQAERQEPAIPERTVPTPDEPRWLEVALEITASDRQRDYGRPLPNFIRIAMKWTVDDAHKFREGCLHTPLDVALKMVDTKTAREVNTPKDDNWIDTIGYSACVDDMDRHLKEIGYTDGIQAFKYLTLNDYYAILQYCG